MKKIDQFMDKMDQIKYNKRENYTRIDKSKLKYLLTLVVRLH